ncbi:MAG: NADH-quinone oxidoreductase subunit N [Catenulispora sp.]|nr:NADH-quinone oxidoreductase subunit N [Catenulispora sp.]
MQPLRMLPEILMFLGGLAALISGSFLPRRRQWVARLVAAGALIATTAVSVVQLAGPGGPAFDGTFEVDAATGLVRVAAAVGTLLVIVAATDEVADGPRESEFYALLLFATTGTVVLGGAVDLLVVAVAFLLASIPLYGLVGMVRGTAGAEAALKTYLMGALFGILLLLGVTVLSALASTSMYVDLRTGLTDMPRAAVAIGFVGVLAGLLFKAGGVPAHFWVPDAAQGSGGAAATYLTTVPKIGALVAVYRLIVALPPILNWQLLVAIIAAVSMTLGNLAAYWQQDPRRLLGWSTISQVGYLLVPVAVAGASDLALPSLLLYVAGYTVTNIAAFTVTMALPDRRELASYKGLARTRPGLAFALLVSLLGLIGTPPTVVFVGKLTVATAAWDGGLQWLAVAVLANSLISLFYYLRWIVPAFQSVDAPARRTDPGSSRWSGRTAGLAAGLSLALGLGAGALWSVFS